MECKTKMETTKLLKEYIGSPTTAAISAEAAAVQVEHLSSLLCNSLPYLLTMALESKLGACRDLVFLMSKQSVC